MFMICVARCAKAESSACKARKVTNTLTSSGGECAEL